MNLINLDHLKNKKNLLAFSHGTDSSALFYALIKEEIDFDIAIVNYNTRETSCQETNDALYLAKKYNKICFTHSVVIENISNFEMTARNIRYVFLNKLIFEYGYENLITGHNLNDKMEWFLMQMTRGAGVKELFGMEPISKKDIMDSGVSYDVVRPLLSTPKQEILFYLETNEIHHFFDESNNDEKYTRNFFRKNYVEDLVKDFAPGISKTFDILEKEVSFVHEDIIVFDKKGDHTVLSASGSKFVSIAVSYLKKYGSILSGGQRDSLLKEKELVYTFDGRLFVMSFFEDSLFISPYLHIKMSKDFKDKMRIEKVPVKHRPYLFYLYKENMK